MRIVIPSVAYADLLAVTLPAWQAVFPHAEVTVVTTAADVETQRLATAAGVACHVTDAWTRPGPTSNVKSHVGLPPIFNIALAKDEAFGFITGDPPEADDVCLAVDADVYPAGSTRTLESIRPAVVYGCPRYRCARPEDLAAYLAGNLPLAGFPLIGPRLKGNVYHGRCTPEEAGRRCLGYFQLFRYRPGLRFGSYYHAAEYDLHFHRQFTRTERLAGWSVLHLGEPNARNWGGRILPAWGAVAC